MPDHYPKTLRADPNRERAIGDFKDRLQADRANEIFHRTEYLAKLWNEIESLCKEYRAGKAYMTFNERLDMQDKIDEKAIEYSQF